MLLSICSSIGTLSSTHFPRETDHGLYVSLGDGLVDYLRLDQYICNALLT